METKKIRRLFKIGVVLAALSVVFNIIAYSTTGWFIQKKDNTTYWSGLWYVTECNENDDCTTMSRREYIMNYGFLLHKVMHSDIVRWEVFMTFAMLCSIACVVMYGIALFRPTHDKRIRLVILICSVVAGFILLHDIGIILREADLFTKDAENDPNKTIYFPWSLFLACLAAFLILSVACISCFLEFKMNQNGGQQEDNDTQDGISSILIRKSFTRIGIIISIIAVVFHIIAYIGNGWRIGIDGTTNSTWNYGLWYRTACLKNDDCTTISWEDIFDISFSLAIYSFEYSRIVRTQVLLTLSLLLFGCCQFLLVVEYRRPQRNKRLGIILSSLLSGTFWMYDIGHSFRLFAIDMDDNGTTAYFPWSVFIALLGTILILILTVMYIVKECYIAKNSSVENTVGENVEMSENPQNVDIM